MTDWVSEVNTLRDPSDVTFAERLAKVHNHFEKIHPYLDGNGRSGRLLLNLRLVRLGYPLAIVFKSERTKYLTAMRGPTRAITDRWVNSSLVLSPTTSISLSCRRSRPSSARTVGEPGRQGAGFTILALSAAAERGRVKAQRYANGTWLSFRKWVEDLHIDPTPTCCAEMILIARRSGAATAAARRCLCRIHLTPG